MPDFTGISTRRGLFSPEKGNFAAQTPSNPNIILCQWRNLLLSWFSLFASLASPWPPLRATVGRAARWMKMSMFRQTKKAIIRKPAPAQGFSRRGCKRKLAANNGSAFCRFPVFPQFFSTFCAENLAGQGFSCFQDVGRGFRTLPTLLIKVSFGRIRWIKWLTVTA